MEDESRWQRQVLIGLVMLLVGGALLGVVVAFAGIKVADLAGINNDTSTTTSAQRLQVPRNAQTTTSPSAPDTGPTSPTGPAPTTTRATENHPADAITLTLSPTTVATYATITIAGTYHAPDGTTLQVQRREGGHWAEFPVTATVSGAHFTTTIQTGHFGLNHFRVTDYTTGISSKPASVTVL